MLTKNNEFVEKKLRIIILLSVLPPAFGVVRLKEIPAQNLADSAQHLAVDAATAKDAVSIGALAAQHPREPCHAALLSPQFLFYQSPYVYVVHQVMVFVTSAVDI